MSYVYVIVIFGVLFPLYVWIIGWTYKLFDILGDLTLKAEFSENWIPWF